MAGFGTVNLLPGIAPLRIDTAITLPIGVEAYAALALHVWLTRTDRHSRAAIYARRSAFAALAVGAIGQVAYHLMASAGVTHAPTPITVLVAILPVAVLGMATSLVTIVRAEGNQQRECEPHASTERSSL
jgi:cytochrome bd-type quinol oxidase subunit 2